MEISRIPPIHLLFDDQSLSIHEGKISKNGPSLCVVMIVNPDCFAKKVVAVREMVLLHGHILLALPSLRFHFHRDSKVLPLLCLKTILSWKTGRRLAVRTQKTLDKSPWDRVDLGRIWGRFVSRLDWDNRPHSLIPLWEMRAEW
jgi:hypothetical protein